MGFRRAGHVGCMAACLGFASLEDLRESTGAEEHVVLGAHYNGSLFRRVELHRFELAQLAGTRQLPPALWAITVHGWSEAKHLVLIRQ